jgi:hypothetical protein
MTRTFRLGSAALSILLVGLSAALAPTAQAATGSSGAPAQTKPALAPTHGDPGKAVLRVAHVPASSIPAARRKQLIGPDAVGHLGSYTIYEFQIYPVNGTHKCLDASTSSSYAGQPGDPIQLYSCFNNYTNDANQWWNPINTTGDYVELENWRYPALCLDAIGTVSSNAPDGQAELVYCNASDSSQLWDWYDFRRTIGNSGSGNFSELYYGGNSGYSLAAYDSGADNPGANGDPVTLWYTYSGVGYEEFTY